MEGILYQIFNLILIIALLGVPIVITVLLLQYFGKNKNVSDEDFLIEKIRELERRIEALENER